MQITTRAAARLGDGPVVAAGTGLPAQTAKQRNSKRASQLEAQVQAPIGAQQQQQATPQTRTTLDQVRVAQAAPVMQAEDQFADPPQATDGRFSYGGFIKVDAMVTDTSDGEIADGSAGRLFTCRARSRPAADESSADIDTHAQFRAWFAADGEAGHKTCAYLEFDLFGGGSSNLGNQAANTHALTLRQPTSWDRLAGQTGPTSSVPRCRTR
jgi:hypothetical protein